MNQKHVVSLLISLLLGLPAIGKNLVPDASFEGPAPLRFSVRGGKDGFVERIKTADAPDGERVLAFRGWGRKGATLLSKPLRLERGGVASLTADVRSVVPYEGTAVSLCVMDKTGKQELARVATVTLAKDDQWRKLAGKVELPSGEVCLAFVVEGAWQGGGLHLDRLGLFLGEEEPVTDNVDWEFVEASTLANGGAWVEKAHFPRWYSGYPLGGKMLSGSEARSEMEENAPAIAKFSAKHAGEHTLWVRLLGSRRYDGPFTVTIRQGEKEITSRALDTAEPGESLRWIWRSIPVVLEKGSVEVVMERPGKGTSNLARNIDVLCLTNLSDYEPEYYDFAPRVFVRWTNTGEGEPYCFYVFSHRNWKPWFHAPGMMTKIGLSGPHFVPANRDVWVGPGERTPWQDISYALLQVGDFNRVRMVATRSQGNKGLVQERVKGTMEFALGDPSNIVKTVEFDQEHPRLWFAIPGLMSEEERGIETPVDFIARSRKALAGFENKGKPLQKHLNISMSIELAYDLDGEHLMSQEYSIMRDLGFNGLTYLRGGATQFGSADKVREWFEQHDLQPRFSLTLGAYFMTLDGDQTRPDTAKMERGYRELAEKNRGLLEHVPSILLADEPAGPSYEKMRDSESARAGFREYLKRQGVTPEEVGFSQWEDVIPTVYADREKNAPLFYYSALYRLEIPAELARTVVKLKNEHLASHIKTFVNYSPPFSWVSRGVDPFLVQRNGGLEMGWSEDWLGYDAGVQYISDTYAFLRGACENQPLGGYIVAKSGPANLQRIKYYATIAGGVTQASLFKYGPAYVGADSWSEHGEKYRVLSQLNAEMAAIDEALHGTTRHPSKVAILYNRTSAIWEGDDYTAEIDARFQRWALTHAGYDADILAEEDVEAGKLASYRALYFSGIQLREKTAENLAAWVKKGGTLVGSAGAGSRDEFNRPMAILEPVFGAKSVSLVVRAPSGRPKYELRNQRILEVGKTFGDAVPAATFKTLCYDEKIEPLGGSTIIATSREDHPVGVIKPFGKGRAVRLATLPGLAYISGAITAAGYQPNTHLPKAFDPGLRDFLTWPARLAGIAPIARTNLSIPEVVRYDGPGRSVFFVINYANEGKDDFWIDIPDVAWAKKGYTANGAPITLKPNDDGTTRVSFSLDIAGVLVLEE